MRILLVVCLIIVSATADANENRRGFAMVLDKPSVCDMKRCVPVRNGPKPIGIDNAGTVSHGAPDMYQGDIKLNKDQMAKKANQTGRALLASNDDLFEGFFFDIRWPQGIVPYTILLNYTQVQIDLIKSGMALITNRTGGCITFRERLDTDEDYVEIYDSADGCFSNVGRQLFKQQLSLDTNGCLFLGTIVHELLHAIGFNHEQSRTDRDDFITVNFQNIEMNNFNQFDKENGTFQNTTYDYSSIMHYSSFDFSRNNMPTIVPNDPTIVLIAAFDKTEEQIMSMSDVLALQRFYNCTEIVQAATTDQTTTTITPTTEVEETGGGDGPVLGNFQFRIENNLKDYDVRVYCEVGEMVNFKYSVKAGELGPLTTTDVGTEWYIFSDDFKFTSFFIAGKCPFRRSGMTIYLSTLKWYCY